jgi:hypothetical protein
VDLENCICGINAYENQQQQGINKISEISQKMVGNDGPKKVK